MSNKIGWMGFFMLLVVVLAFAFIVIGMNSQNAVQDRGQNPQDDTELQGVTDYNEKATGQAGLFDMMFFQILAIAIVIIMALIGIGILVNTVGRTWRRLRGGSRGTGT